MIDLHLHTTASDGRCTPRELVERVAAAGVSVMAVTDHDTTAAVAEVRAIALESGMQAISGIEITAVEEGRDLHVLGYMFDPSNEALGAFLLTQRATRIARVEAIRSRLAALGVHRGPGAAGAAGYPRERPLGRAAAGRAGHG